MYADLFTAECIFFNGFYSNNCLIHLSSCWFLKMQYYVSLLKGLIDGVCVTEMRFSIMISTGLDVCCESCDMMYDVMKAVVWLCDDGAIEGCHKIMLDLSRDRTRMRRGVKLFSRITIA